MIKKVSMAIVLAVVIVAYNTWAQYINLSGNNPAIREYVEADAANWDKPIMYVFYDNQLCSTCVQAMNLIYDIYEENYASTMSLFEINYAVNDEYQFRLSYDLNQPLSVVIVRINDGLSRGYYKIDNPQQWLGDPFYFKQNLITQINNFLN